MPKEKLASIKEAIHNSDRLSESEKSQSVKHLEEWVTEDKAFGIVFNELIELNIAFK